MKLYESFKISGKKYVFWIKQGQFDFSSWEEISIEKQMISFHGIASLNEENNIQFIIKIKLVV